MLTRLRETHVHVRALKPQAVNNSQVNGDAIVRPWKEGRKMMFEIASGDLSSGDSLTFGLEMRRQGTSTWDTVKQPNGSTALVMTAQTYAATTGTLAARLKDGLVAIGEIDLTDLKTDKDIGGAAYDYDAIRLTAVNGAAQNVTCAATAYIADLYSEPGGDEDYEDFYDKQRYTGGDSSVEP